MTQSREIVFIDSTVSDLNTLLAGLRPGIEAVMLPQAQPASESHPTSVHTTKFSDRARNA
jgi:hypothetical protein